MSLGYYLDENGNPVETDDWNVLENLLKSDRHVGDTKIGELHISTVFLVFDQSFGHNKTPILFETMVFGPEENPWTGTMFRYKTKEEAIKGHEKLCKEIKDQIL